MTCKFFIGRVFGFKSPVTPDLHLPLIFASYPRCLVGRTRSLHATYPRTPPQAADGDATAIKQLAASGLGEVTRHAYRRILRTSAWANWQGHPSADLTVSVCEISSGQRCIGDALAADSPDEAIKDIIATAHSAVAAELLSRS
jgi:hypothetical protein